MIMTNKIFGRIREEGTTIGRVAEAIKMKPHTLSKKIKGISRIYHDEIIAVSKELHLSEHEILSFFYPEVSKYDTKKNRANS